MRPYGSVRRNGNLPRMTETSSQSIRIAAPPAAVTAVICDFSKYPEWVSAVRSTEIVEEYEDGYASQVRFVLDAGPMTDEYVLEYAYAEDLSRIEWQLTTPSRVQRAQTGSYDVTAVGDGNEATVTYTLAVDLAMPMLGMLKRKAEKMIMDAALTELKRRVETLPPD